MGVRFGRVLAALLIACAAVAGAANPPGPSASAAATALESEQERAEAAVRAAHKPGPADIALRDQGTLHLLKGYVWIPVPAATQLMRVMGNSPGPGFMGLIVPDNDDDWMATVTFINEGYIKDDDARDWNADELLQSLKEGTEEGNKERARRGIAPIEVIGWAQPPKYDTATHRLVWAATLRDKGAADTKDQGVNYNTYALGREGYISLNLVTNASELEKYKPEAMTLLAALQYGEGKRYADFNGSTDKVAAYGLAALVAGAAAKKLGLLAVVLAALAKFGKLLIVAAAGALWGVRKFFKRKE
ncbi:MAG: DUF2167 domain-containing protein [Desulfovibrionaceae bacterium]|nr:DUF2167 domain-containing protein [Desulfovibrionaceae bacterium]